MFGDHWGSIVSDNTGATSPTPFASHLARVTLKLGGDIAKERGQGVVE